jgi:hypothetical protein
MDMLGGWIVKTDRGKWKLATGTIGTKSIGRSNDCRFCDDFRISVSFCAVFLLVLLLCKVACIHPSHCNCNCNHCIDRLSLRLRLAVAVTVINNYPIFLLAKYIAENVKFEFFFVKFWWKKISHVKRWKRWLFFVISQMNSMQKDE